MGGLIGASLLAVIGLPVFGIVLGLLQQAWYRRQVRAGRLPEDEVPFFGLLLLRGMLVGFALLAVAAIVANLHQPPAVQQPPGR
jgi:hypothetical protein